MGLRCSPGSRCGPFLLCPLEEGGKVGTEEKVLKIDRPMAGGFLSLTALRAEGCGIAYGDGYVWLLRSLGGRK